MDVSSLIEMKPNPKIATFAPGDTVKVRAKIVEGDKERIQVFQGVVIRIRHGGAGATFTVRRVSYGIGVERTFLFHSPMVDGVELVRHGKVRRAKLYYLRGLSTKASRIKEKRLTEKEKEELAQAQALAPEALAEKAEIEAPAQAEPETKAQAKPETKAQAEPETKAQAKPETKAQAEPETKAQAKPETKAQAKPETKAQAEPETKAQTKPETKAQTEEQSQAKEKSPDKS